jgi:acyl carrier protein
VKEGDPITPALKASGVFPAMVAGMVDVGEQTGALPEMLLKIADTYDDEVDNAVGAMTSLLEPIMIVFLAVIVGSIVMDQQLATQVKEAIARSLKLPMAPEDIADDIPLFGEGLGLDSIDVLELVLELERTFNVKITDEQLGRRALRSVRTIVELIEQTRGQAPAEAK